MTASGPHPAAELDERLITGRDAAIGFTHSNTNNVANSVHRQIHPATIKIQPEIGHFPKWHRTTGMAKFIRCLTVALKKERLDCNATSGCGVHYWFVTPEACCPSTVC